MLANSVLDFIELIMHLESKNKLPTYEIAKAAIERDRDEWNWNSKITTALGAKKIVAEREENRAPVKCFATNYDANDASVEVPIPHDLASDDTLAILMDYSVALSKQCLSDQEATEEDYEPIMNNVYPYLLGDGNPIWGIYKLRRKKALDKRINAYFGGFHLILEVHKKRGLMFGDTHLRDIFGKWRKTDKQLDWVLDPGDPNQVDEESTMYHLGEYMYCSFLFVH